MCAFHRSPKQGYDVESIRSEQVLDSMQQEWAEVLATDPDAPIFLSWDWITTWWRHYSRRNMSPWVLAARDTDGRLVGLFPLMLVQERYGGIGVFILRPIGCGIVCPCHLRVIAAPAKRVDVTKSFFAFLFEHLDSWDVLDLEGVADETLAVTMAELPFRRTLEARAAICPYVSLPEEWDSYHGGLDRKLRRNLKYFENLLEREHPGEVSFRRLAETADVIAAMDALVAMHRVRHENTTFNEPDYVAFHREIATRALARGWLRFYVFESAGTAIAALYCFRFGARVYAYQIGFAPEWARYSLGRLLAGRALRDSIDEGAVEFDWLQGDHAYKYEWTDLHRYDRHVLASVNWRGDSYLAATRLRERSIAIGKKVVPEQYMVQLERLATHLSLLA